MLAIPQTDTLMTHLQQKLESLATEHRARQTKFVQRTPKKITPLNFVLGLIHIVLTGGSALVSLATAIGLKTGQLLSKQAVAERITDVPLAESSSSKASWQQPLLSRYSDRQQHSVRSWQHRLFRKRNWCAIVQR
jgi:hypothetical protein